MSSSNEDLAGLADRYAKVQERLENAIIQAGRKRTDVQLIAVSKLHSAEIVAACAQLGQVDFGENYVQEALEKQEQVQGLGANNVRWHMIGHVQSRKAPQVIGQFAYIHTLDSQKLAQALEKRCAAANVTQKVLIEVNVGDESQKAGINRTDLHALTDTLMSSCPHLELEGLMCIPPVFDAGEAARPYFALLRELIEELRRYSNLALPHLSMGMSGDFEWAIMEGATFVRVGTDIFGLRPPKNA